MYNLLIMLLLLNSLAHIVQAFQAIKNFNQEITPLLIFSIVALSLALGLFLRLPYALYITLGLMLIGGIGSGNQILRLDNGGCLNWGIVILNVIIVILCIMLLFVGI